MGECEFDDFETEQQIDEFTQEDPDWVGYPPSDYAESDDYPAFSDAGIALIIILFGGDLD